MDTFLILASASILNLQCVGSGAGSDRILDFTLDLSSRSGELVYNLSGESNLFLSDRLTVTSNYISFPFMDTAITISRKDASFTLGNLEGFCEVVDRETPTVF